MPVLLRVMRRGFRAGFTSARAARMFPIADAQSVTGFRISASVLIPIPEIMISATCPLWESAALTEGRERTSPWVMWRWAVRVDWETPLARRRVVNLSGVLARAVQW